MSDKPLVSVLMGAYNCAGTLAESIDSILAQDYENIELIVCEDGSTDGTAALLDEWAARDRRIVVLKNESNRGLAYSLNRCIEVAKGIYLVRMDGDDIAHPDRIGKQIAFLEAHPEFDLCGSSIALFDSAGIWGRVDYPERVEAGTFLFRSPFAHPTVVFRASILRRAGGYDCDPCIGRYEDYDLFMRLHAAGSRGCNLAEPLLDYREDRAAFRKRKFKYALIEARVRFRGFSSLGLLPRGLPYVIKPILIGLFPKSIYSRLRRGIYGK